MVMSSGSLNMAGAALGAAFSLLLYASITQGLRDDVERVLPRTREAEVGQNITLECNLKKQPDLKLVHIEWRKKTGTKLALYNPDHGTNLFWKNVTLQIQHNDTQIGSYLHVPEVKEWDSGIYICDILLFPSGSIKQETELRIKDVVRITCDVDHGVDVQSGENVTIHCRAFPHAQYRWTKNGELVSESESLELVSVTDVHSGVYTLTVNAGNQTVHKEFPVRVQKAAAHSQTDPTTVLPQSYTTHKGFLKPINESFTTSPSTGLSTTDTNVTWTTEISTNVTDDGPNGITTPENGTSFTNSTHFSVTHTDPYPSATISSSSPVWSSTSESRIEDIFSSRPEDESSTSGYFTGKYNITSATPTLTTGNNVGVVEDTAQNHLAVFVIVPVLLLIAVAGLLYRRRVIKQRMDQPPPFKPPPPPVKYTNARQHDIYSQHFPASRCNSVELGEMDQMLISV